MAAWEAVTEIQVMLNNGLASTVTDVYVYDGTDWQDVDEVWAWATAEPPPPEGARYDISLYGSAVYA